MIQYFLCCSHELNGRHIDEVWDGINNLQVLVEEDAWQCYHKISKWTKRMQAQQVSANKQCRSSQATPR